MNYNDELCKMEKRVYSEEMLNFIIEAHKKEIACIGGTDGEVGYDETMKKLRAQLDEQQRRRLNTVERKYMECAALMLPMGFERGMFACFKQLMGSETEELLFQELIVENILEAGGGEASDVYLKMMTEGRCLAEELAEKIDGGVDKLTFIDEAWDECIYGILRHSFYLGYRCGMKIAGKIVPIGEKVEMAEKIHRLEYELGIIKSEEQLAE